MSLLTPEELRELRRVHIQAGRRVDAMFAGDYRAAVRGQGMEFEEVRPYQPGDDVRHVDWNVTARTGDPFVKVFREERQLTVLLVVDVSGSTRVGTGGLDGKTTRQLQLARVAGGLAYATFRNRDQVGLLTFSDQVETYLSPRRTRGHVWAVIQSVFQGASSSTNTDLAQALTHVAGLQRRRCVIIVLSDFLDPGAWDTPMGVLARRHTVHAVCLTDPLDDSPGPLGLLQVRDAESGAMRLIDSHTLRGRMPAAHRLQRLRRTGVQAFEVSTSDDVFSVLHRQFQRRGSRR